LVRQSGLANLARPEDGHCREFLQVLVEIAEDLAF
jgi:hypothetical protein